MDATPLQFLRHEFPNTSIQDCYSKLGRFNLNQKLARKKIRLLSGGEKSRLAFSILTWWNPHLVIMDEPTNHLDIQTQDALIGALKDFEGSLILVSHDKHLLTECCNEFWVVGNRTVTTFENFDKARTFCYKRCKPIDVLPREFSTINTKKVKAIPKKAKMAAAEDVMAQFTSTKASAKKDLELIIDGKREIQRGINKGLIPDKILVHLKGWDPVDGNRGPLDTLAFDMFSKFFTDPLFANQITPEFFDAYLKILKKVVPLDHMQNQFTLLTIAQSSWYTSKGEGFARAKEENILGEIFECFYNFDIVSKEVFGKWLGSSDDDTIGRNDALADVQEFMCDFEIEAQI